MFLIIFLMFFTYWFPCNPLISSNPVRHFLLYGKNVSYLKPIQYFIVLKAKTGNMLLLLILYQNQLYHIKFSLQKFLRGSCSQVPYMISVLQKTENYVPQKIFHNVFFQQSYQLLTRKFTDYRFELC